MHPLRLITSGFGFGLLTLLSNVRGQTCGRKSLDGCEKKFDSFNVHRKRLVLDNVLPSWNSTELTALCSAYKMYATCMKSIKEDCKLTVKLHYDGLDDAYKHMCNKSSWNEYLSHQKCFGEKSLQTAASTCNNTLSSNLQLALLKAQDEKRDLYCRYYEDYLKCLSVAVQKECGKSAEKWQRTFVANILRPYLSYLKCPAWGSEKHDSDWSSVVIAMAIVIVLTFALLLCVIASFAFAISRKRNARSRRNQPVQPPNEVLDLPPAYTPPYVVYGQPAPNYESLQIVGIGPTSSGDPQIDPNGIFKGTPVQPPPYNIEIPPSSELPLATESHAADASQQEDTVTDNRPTESTYVNNGYCEDVEQTTEIQNENSHSYRGT